jgi:hypothetical protein
VRVGPISLIERTLRLNLKSNKNEVLLLEVQAKMCGCTRETNFHNFVDLLEEFSNAFIFHIEHCTFLPFNDKFAPLNNDS